VKIVHMMFLSWAGRRIDKVLQDSDNVMKDPRWKTQIARASDDLVNSGVRHNDLRPVNILWDDRVCRIMVVDFERSEVAHEPPMSLSLSSGNKRKRVSAGRKESQAHLEPA
jgi:hypothetical protein